jgi:surface protein
MAYDKVVDSAALDASLTAVADAIRAKGKTTEKLKLDDMPAAIAAIGVVDHTKGGVWQRPDGATDLDALTYGTDELYMTYDCTERIDDPHASFKIVGTAYTVTIGTQSWTKAADEELVYAFTSSDGTYPLVHIKADGNITGFNFTAYTVDGRSYEAQANPVIERVGDVCDFGLPSTNNIWASYYVEREKVTRRECNNPKYGMNYVWRNCSSLQSLDLSGWNMANWNLTTIEGTWQICSSLQSLDLSGWDTTNWNVASLYSTWQNCSSLQSLDLSGWNTTNWNVTSLENTFAQMRCLTYLDISCLDMSKILLFGGNYVAMQSCIETFKCGESKYGKFVPTSYLYLKLETPRKISRASPLEIGKMLGTVTTAHYLVIGSAASAKLTKAEKAEITAKGWTVS